MKTMQKGFTLIELMIVVAIIAILAAIAIPQYQSYVARTQLSEAMSLADGLKTQTIEYWSQKGEWPENDDDNGFAAAEKYSGKYVKQIDLGTDGNDGLITATMKPAGDVSSAIAGKKVQLSADISDSTNESSGTIVWTCSSDADAKYLPASCETGL